ncbi:MAG: alpha/beta fold hydrolase [Actinomycetota bacterium]
MKPPVRKTLHLSEIELSYLEWKPGTEQENQPRLLLLHGLADSAVVWSSLGNNLATHYHIIAPDLRGHGESSKPDTGYSFQQVIADLEALMSRLNWQSAHILGHSWAGKLNTLWAREKPERFCSMILVDPIFITKMPRVFKLTLPILYRKLDCLKCMGPFASYQQAELLAQQLGQYAGWSELQQAVFHSNMEQKPNGSWGSKFGIPARNQMFEEVMEVAGLTEPINVPTLFIQPQRGVNRMAWQMQPYKTYLKGLKIERVPGNHWAFLVEPEAFNQTVVKFLEVQGS